MKGFRSHTIYLFRSSLFKNSSWGVLANILQTGFLTIFFIIVARKYQTESFANFVLATTLYQIFVAVSTMNLGQWFIREYSLSENKSELTCKFLKIQLFLGVLFYGVCTMTSIFLYSDNSLRLITAIYGLNIIIDNLIYALSRFNIAEERQRSTAVVMIIDGFLRLLIGAFIFIYPLSMIQLTLLLVATRFVSLNFMLNVGLDKYINIRKVISTKLSFRDVRNFIFFNWLFVIIGGMYILNWRLANVFISKYLTLSDVAIYEVAFKIYSVAVILPTIVSNSVYPKFISYYKNQDKPQLQRLYYTMFTLYTLYSLFCFAFIYSFGGWLIPYIFGDAYKSAANLIDTMFITLIFVTTASLQANLLIAMKLERLDMRFNFVNLALNLLGCVIGLQLSKSLNVITYSILIAIIVFHILQDIVIIRRNISTVRSVVLFYISIGFFLISYRLIHVNFNEYYAFGSSVIILAAFGVLTLRKYNGMTAQNRISISLPAHLQKREKIVGSQSI